MQTDPPLIEQPQVVKEVLAGDGLSLAEAGRLVPPFRPGRPTNPATIWRWSAKGIRLPDGTVIKLETCRVGGRKMTSRAALGRFILAQTPQSETDPGPLPAASLPSRRNRSVIHASRVLDRLGL
jgi:hypothetical protein